MTCSFKFCWLLLVALTFNLTFMSGCSGVSLKRTSEQLPLVGKRSVFRYQLKNGLKVLVAPDPDSPTVAFQVWYHVGSKDEKPGQTGLAHLFEHLMFKQTSVYGPGEFDRIMELAGSEGANAFTDQDYTAYVLEVPSDEVDTVARLEAIRMKNLIVNKAAFKTEIEVVQNERRFRNENNPDGYLYQKIFEIAFDRHPYRWPVIGYQRDLARMKVSHAKAFYQKYYSPSNATVVITGGISPSNAISIVDRYFGKIPAGNAVQTKRKPEPRQRAPKRRQFKFNIKNEKIYVAFRIPAYGSEDTLPLELLQALLTDGRSSRLQKVLVDSGIATSVFSGALHKEDPTLFLIGAELQSGKKAIVAENRILAELNRLRKKSVSKEELNRAKSLLKLGFFKNFTNNHQTAEFLGRYETIKGDFRSGLALADTRSIDPKIIRKTAAKYFNPTSRVVAIGASR